MKRLFIYGTLMPGERNQHILEPINGNYEEAFLQGKLYKNGWEGGSSCPGLDLESPEETIHGYVIGSEELEKHWSMLDEFEGEHYKRVTTRVTLKGNNQQVDAFVYVINNQS